MTLSAEIPRCPTGTRRAALTASAIGCLDAYVDAWVAAPPDLPDDAGPAVLATLVLATGQPTAEWYASRALTVWLHGFHRGNPRSGLYRGHAGYVAGLTEAALAQHRMRRLVDREAQALADRWTVGPATRGEYSLADGVAGAVLALACDPNRRPELVLPLARRLTGTAGWPADLPPGLRCGVAGVVAALRAACEIAGPRDDLVSALRRACDHLVGCSTVDGLDTVDALDTVDGQDASWAEGTPGIAWTLWDAGRVLGDVGLQLRAAHAMDDCCTRLLARLPGTGPLDFAHGAAGTLAVADAFARYAHLPTAAELRDRIEERLMDRLPEVDAIVAGRDGPAGDRHTLLHGVTGVLAVLLTVAAGVTGGNASRRWLIQFGLR